ncbi:hypothetical protein RF55_5888 [Lasius niger]|uniref:Uncharacterized protein n=1 Tax=Lasius niger TaxID=67767 RepID=A0A0J7KUP8_LASNI|nr:hypothetical protein RF55_5888 [Lasius niger]
MSMDMDCLILAQDDLQTKMSNVWENTQKLGKENITVTTVDVRLQRLEKMWEKFEKQHDELRAKFWDKLKTKEYITENSAGLAEDTY